MDTSILVLLSDRWVFPPTWSTFEKSFCNWWWRGEASGQECLVFVTSCVRTVVKLPTALSDVPRGEKWVWDVDNSWLERWRSDGKGCWTLSSATEDSMFWGRERLSRSSISCVLCFLGSIIWLFCCWSVCFLALRTVYVSPNWGIMWWKLRVSGEGIDSRWEEASLEPSSLRLKGTIEVAASDGKTLSSTP